MEKTKIQLSPDELLLMQNSDWILTKNSVIDKINLGFGNLVAGMQQELVTASLVDERIILNAPKISRGEKYQGLPYVMLDYPRLFGKEDIIAIRTFFWWGNYCSITLHVKGNCRELVSGRIRSAYNELRNAGFYVSFSGDEWTHDVTKEDYQSLANMSTVELDKLLPGTAFLKIAAKVEIAPWDEMERRLFDLFLRLSDFLKT